MNEFNKSKKLAEKQKPPKGIDEYVTTSGKAKVLVHKDTSTFSSQMDGFIQFYSEIYKK
jgi:hypothetical protein